MCRNNHLITITPESSGKLYSYLMSLLGCYLAFGKALVSVISNDAVFLVELFLYCHKLVSCYCRIAVDSRYKELFLCLVFICSVVHNICQILKAAFVPSGVCCFLFVGSIVKRRIDATSYGPQLGYRHFSSASSGVRNLASIAAWKRCHLSTSSLRRFI